MGYQEVSGIIRSDLKIVNVKILPKIFCGLDSVTSCSPFPPIFFLLIKYFFIEANVIIIEENLWGSILSYEKLNISSHKVHRSKKEHKLAVFELCKGITNLLQESNCSVFQRIYDDLEKMCYRFRK